MTTHRNAKRKVWTGLVLVLLGASTVVAAPVGAEEESSGNLTCEAVIGELGLTDVVMAKDDVQRTAPYEGVAANGDFVVTYRFDAAPDGAPEAYMVTFSSADLVYGAFVKQAAEKQGLSREALFPTGTLTGSVHVPDGELSHVSFCTGTVPTTDPPATDPPATEPPVTEPPETSTEVGGGVVVPTPAPDTEAAPEAEAAPTVLGDTVVRTLPRTGSLTLELGVLGVVLVLLGSALVARGGQEMRRRTTG